MQLAEHVGGVAWCAGAGAVMQGTKVVSVEGARERALGAERHTCG
jgi:hypothetical protein